MHLIDIAVQTYLVGIRTPVGVEFMYILTSIFKVIPFSVIVLFSAVFVYKKRGILYSILLSFSFVSVSVLAWLLKNITNINRPIDILVAETDKSFPSWHAAAATVFFGMLIYIFSDKLNGIKKVIFNAFCILMILLISFSRLYLGAHWLSDVLGGIILGLLVSYFSIKIYDYLIRENRS